jgi:hypothetical protein
MTSRGQEYRFWRSGFRFGIASALALIGVASPLLSMGLEALATHYQAHSLDTPVMVLWFCTGGFLLGAAIAELITWVATRRRQAVFELAAVAAVFSWWNGRFEVF